MTQLVLEGKVLITGASGFIGGELRSRLVSEGLDVVAIRRPGSPPSEEGRSVEAAYADVATLERIVAEERPDYVLHVAGVTKGSSYDDFREGNVVPTRNLLTAVRTQHGSTKRFVLVSSLAAYGPSSASARQREGNPPRPVEHYGESKLEAERVVERESGEVAWTIVRPCAVYGPGDVDHFTLFQAASLGVNLFYGNRDRHMSWIYVDDCVRGILQAASHENSVGKGYFLAHDPPGTWGEFQAEIANTMGKRVRTVDLPELLLWVGALGGELATCIDKKPRLMNLQKARLGAQEAWTCSGDAARKDIGFNAEIGLSEGIRRTHRWYVENQWYWSPSLRRLVGRLRD